MEKLDINEIILVDGSTRIPKIKNLLQEFFNERKEKSVKVIKNIMKEAEKHNENSKKQP